MRTKELLIFVKEYDAVVELPDSDRDLILAAREASVNAYAPYSNFHVGAALLLENGKVITGNNQENADYTDGICAERVAMFYASSNFPDVPIVAMAVTAKNSKGIYVDFAKPCGSCRQAFIEYEARFKNKIRLILDGNKKIHVFEGADNLLPFAFKPDSLD